MILHTLLGAGSTLVPSYSLLSAEAFFPKLRHLQIVQSEKAIVPNEAHFLLIEHYSRLIAP